MDAPASNAELTLIDLWNKYLGDGRPQAIKKFELSAGLLLPDHTWEGYAHTNLITSLADRTIIRVSSATLGYLNVQFRLLDINKFTAAALLEKLCDDLKLNMEEITGINPQEPCDAEYCLYLYLIIAVCTGRRTDLLDEFISKTYGLHVRAEEIAAMLSTEVNIVHSNALNEKLSQAMRPPRKQEASIKLSEKGELALKMARQQGELNLAARLAKNMQKKLEALVPVTFENSLLIKHAQKVGMKATLLQARRNVVRDRNVDHLAVRSTPRRVTNQRPIAFALYANGMSLKKFLLKTLNLNCSSDLFNKSIVDNLKVIDMYDIRKVTRDLVDNSKKFGFQVTEEIVKTNLRNHERAELLNENVNESIRDLIIALDSMTLSSNEHVKHYCAQEDVIVLYDGSFKFSSDVQLEDARKVNILSEQIINENMRLMRPQPQENVRHQGGPQNAQPQAYPQHAAPQRLPLHGAPNVAPNVPPPNPFNQGGANAPNIHNQADLVYIGLLNNPVQQEMEEEAEDDEENEEEEENNNENA